MACALARLDCWEGAVHGDKNIVQPVASLTEVVALSSHRIHMPPGKGRLTRTSLRGGQGVGMLSQT
jgi:hypothetical protein